MMKTMIAILLLGLALTFFVLPVPGGSTAKADTLVDLINITGVAEPAVGNIPIFGHVSYGPSEKIYYVSDYAIAGVEWFDETAQKALSGSDRFLSGHIYSFSMQFRAITGYSFGTDSYHISTKSLVNNRLAQVTGYSATHVQVKYTFPALSKPSNIVDKIVIYNAEEPKIGMLPDRSVSYSSGPYKHNASFGISGVQWTDETTHRVMGQYETFMAGHVYTITLEFLTVNGYYFGSNAYDIAVVGTVNGHTGETIGYSTTDVCIRYTFPALPEAVETITVTGIDEPQIGAMPDYSATVSGAGISIANDNSGNWRGGVLWMSPNAINPNSVFEAGKTYTVRVSVLLKEGYTFRDANGNLLTDSATINGHSATIVKYTDTNVQMEYTFPTLMRKTISEIWVYNIDEPEIGKTPDYDVSVSGEGMLRDIMTDNTWKNGVLWYDVTGEPAALNPSEPFLAGHTYTIRVSLYSQDGYSFFDTAEVFAGKPIVNGAPATVHRYSDTNVGIDYTFPALHLFPVNYTGFMTYDNGLFFVSGGDVVTDANGVVQDPNNPSIWYFCAGGQVQLQHSGLAEYDGAWFYVKEGVLDTAFTGLATYNGAQFIVAAGRLLTEANGLIQDPQSGKWVFVAGGQVQSQYRGLALYDGHWFYVWDGVFQADAEGWVEHDGHTFYVIGGMVTN